MAPLTGSSEDRTQALLESEGQGDGVFVEGVFVPGVFRATPVTLRAASSRQTESASRAKAGLATEG